MERAAADFNLHPCGLPFLTTPPPSSLLFPSLFFHKKVLRLGRTASPVQLQGGRHGICHFLPRQRPGRRPPGPGGGRQEVSAGGREGGRGGRTLYVFKNSGKKCTLIVIATNPQAPCCRRGPGRFPLRVRQPAAGTSPLRPRFLPSLPPSHPSTLPSLPPYPQETATKVVGLVDRFKLLLPLPLRLDRNHGSESLEVGREGRREGGREGGRERYGFSGPIVERGSMNRRNSPSSLYTSYPTSRLSLCLCAPAHPSSPHFWTTPTRTQTYPECDCLPRLPRASSQETAAQGKSPGQRQGQGQGQGEEGRKGGRRGRASKLCRLHLLCCAGRPLVVRSSICFSSY